MYILCKANEVFMVGVDVRNLDINQQQHLLGETADQKKKKKKVGEVEEWDWVKPSFFSIFSQYFLHNCSSKSFLSPTTSVHILG